MLKRQDQKRSDLDEQLKEYINEWRKQRAKEEDELKRLKEKQAKRKVWAVLYHQGYNFHLNTVIS